MSQLYSVQGYLTDFESKMESIYGNMYPEDKGKGIAVGIQTFGQYHKLASKEVKNYMFDIESARHMKSVEVAGETTTTYIDKFKYHGDKTDIAKFTGAWFPTFGMTEEYTGEFLKRLNELDSTFSESIKSFEYTGPSSMKAEKYGTEKFLGMSIPDFFEEGAGKQKHKFNKIGKNKTIEFTKGNQNYVLSIDDTVKLIEESGLTYGDNDYIPVSLTSAGSSVFAAEHEATATVSGTNVNKLLKAKDLPFGYDADTGNWIERATKDTKKYKKGDLKIDFKKKFRPLEWTTEAGEVYSGQEGFLKLLQDNPQEAQKVLDSMGMKSVAELLGEELPTKGKSIMDIAGTGASILALASDIIKIGKTTNVQDKRKGMQSAALNAISLLFPAARGFVGAYTVGRNLSEMFGGGSRYR